MWAAGAEEVTQEARYAHLVGAARMGSDPGASVVDSFGQSHDIPNLFICDGSILPTQGSANPGLTIQALAIRTADYLISERENVLARRRGSGAAPPLRKELEPTGVSGRGVPRLGGRSRKGYERDHRHNLEQEHAHEHAGDGMRMNVAGPKATEG